MVSFKTTYFQKSLTCIGCFGLFTNIKKGYGTSFCCRFFAYLFHKNFLIKSSIKWPSSNVWRQWHSGFSRKVPNSDSTWNSAGLFITVIWLFHSQLWAIPETVSLTQCLWKCFLQLPPNLITKFLVTFGSKSLQCSDLHRRWPWGSQIAVLKKYHTYFLTQYIKQNVFLNSYLAD